MTSAEWANAARPHALGDQRRALGNVLDHHDAQFAPGVKPTVTIAGNRSPFLRQSTASYSPWPRARRRRSRQRSLSDSSGQYGIGGEDPSSSLSANPVSSHIFVLTCAMRPSGVDDHEPILQRAADHVRDRRSRSVRRQVRSSARARAASHCACAAVEDERRAGGHRHEPCNCHHPRAWSASRVP